MFRFMTRTAIAAAVVSGALAGSFSVVQAQDVQLRVGPDGLRVENPDRDRDFRRRGGCSPREAIEAARDEGFRRPEVVRITDRSVTVRGWTSDGPDRITFANRRGCPEL
ncbi:hypothetical protein [Oryzifoliimicrobium ureilyticus]|uniref:hypothetical protein n=1 Tax=Oryzifoliimicrobium ureilyticus TaxID=3113724 RepID=UPI0030767284